MLRGDEYRTPSQMLSKPGQTVTRHALIRRWDSLNGEAFRNAAALMVPFFSNPDGFPNGSTVLVFKSCVVSWLSTGPGATIEDFLRKTGRDPSWPYSRNIIGIDGFLQGSSHERLQDLRDKAAALPLAWPIIRKEVETGASLLGIEAPETTFTIPENPGTFFFE